MDSVKNDIGQAEETGTCWDELVKLFPQYAKYGGEWDNDITTNYKLKVVCETDSLYEVIKYLCEAKVSKEEFDTLLDSAQKQINDFITFEKLSYK